LEQKIQNVVERIRNSNDIADAEKPLILEKIEEWREEKAAISELNNKLEVWWLKLEPIFDEMGLV